MVAIKDFEMPKFCCDCRFKQTMVAGETYCMATREYLDVNLNTGKDNRCPLVEVEHDKE